MAKEILLTRGLVAVVDDADFEAVTKYKWYAEPRRGNRAYAVSSSAPEKYLHRFIMKPGPGLVVDHKDHDCLNNRRTNLRVCTPQENQRNMLRPRNNTSGYKGVSYATNVKKWHAYIRSGRKRVNIGWFETAEEAAQAYDQAAVEHFGEFSQLNFPQETTSLDKKKEA